MRALSDTEADASGSPVFRLAVRRAGDVSPLFSPPVAKAVIGEAYGAYGAQLWPPRIEQVFLLAA